MSEPKYAKVWWQFESPNKEIIEGYNLIDLIKQHQHLFDPDDVVWTQGTYGRAPTCKAASRLYQLSNIKKNGEYRNQSWKGWKLTEKMSREHRERVLALRALEQKEDSNNALHQVRSEGSLVVA